MSHPGNEVLEEILRDHVAGVGNGLEDLVIENLRAMRTVIEIYIGMSKMMHVPTNFLEDVLARVSNILLMAHDRSVNNMLE